MSEAGAGDEHSSPSTDPNFLPEDLDNIDGSEQPPRKRQRQRLRLSCWECRRRKLSCDRGSPCNRCVKSGTPNRCLYETREVLSPDIDPGRHQSIDERPPLVNSQDASRESDRFRKLEREMSALKNLLLERAGSERSTGSLIDHSPIARSRVREPNAEESTLPPLMQPQSTTTNELRFFRGKEFKTRSFGPHDTCMAFNELTGLTMFMKETSDEWLKPLHIAQNPKDRYRPKRKVERHIQYQEPDPVLEALLPPKGDTDILVSAYLDQFEQLYRIVHIPSFRRGYADFWDPLKPRFAARTALILCMMSISSCINSGPLISSKSDGMVISCSHESAKKWIKACEEWYHLQSQKHRKLIHYQIACLLYIAKRVNTFKKKRFWADSGVLVRDAMSLGLHRNTIYMPNTQVTPFYQEMRRRIWATIQELDLQAAFDHRMPTISALHFDVEPPSNLDDEDFDEESAELPRSKPNNQYTLASYQHLSRQSLPLRIELSQLLTGPPQELDYEQVTQHTHNIIRKIDSLPSWDASGHNTSVLESAKKPLLAYTLLHIQLRQYIIPLHQPYLRKTDPRYQFSDIMFYNATRDMVLLHDRLVQQGIQTLNFLREDTLTLAVNLCNVTILQPPLSTNMIMVNSQQTITLLDKCLAMKEDRILRCGNSEPWGYSIMCAAYGLLETHLGVKSAQMARSTCAERFINLHYRLMAGQEPPISQHHGMVTGPAAARNGVPDFETASSLTPLGAPLASQPPQTQSKVPYTPTPWWLPKGQPIPNVS